MTFVSNRVGLPTVTFFQDFLLEFFDYCVLMQHGITYEKFGFKNATNVLGSPTQ